MNFPTASPLLLYSVAPSRNYMTVFLWKPETVALQANLGFFRYPFCANRSGRAPTANRIADGLDFPAWGGKRQGHGSALIVAFATGCEAAGLKASNPMFEPGGRVLDLQRRGALEWSKKDS